MKIQSATCLMLFGLALTPVLARADVHLDVKTDRTSLSLDEALTVQISVRSEGSEAADVSVPEFEGFEIQSQQVQRPIQFSFSFGSRATMQSSSIYTFVLRPLRTGVLVIRPVRAELDGKVRTSRAIQVTVSGSQDPGREPPSSDPAAQPEAQSQDPASGGGQVDPVAFLRQVADKSEAYQGEQITVTIYLYVRQQLQTAPEIVTEPTTDGVWVHDLLPASRTLQAGRQVVGDTLYAVYVLRRFAAFPLRSGEIKIGPMSVQVDTSSPFDIFNPGRAGQRVRRSGQPITLAIKPLPDAGRPPGSVAVGTFQIVTKLDRLQAVTGDALTLTATVHGDGNVRSVELPAPVLANVDVLQPEIKDLVESPNDLVGGTREVRWLLVPRAPGRVSLPPLVLQAFDPRAGRYQSITSGALSFDVVGAALAAAPAQSSDLPARAAPDQVESTKPSYKWAPIRTQSALVRGYRPMAAQPWFGWALAGPFSLWLGVVCSALLRRRLKERALSATGLAQSEAEQRLRAAESAANAGDAPRFHAEASAALLLVFGARLGETLAGLTRTQLREVLKRRGVADDLTDNLISTLERSEFARFSAAQVSADALGAELVAVRKLWKRAEVADATPRENAS